MAQRPGSSTTRLVRVDLEAIATTSLAVRGGPFVVLGAGARILARASDGEPAARGLRAGTPRYVDRLRAVQRPCRRHDDLRGLSFGRLGARAPFARAAGRRLADGPGPARLGP